MTEVNKTVSGCEMGLISDSETYCKITSIQNYFSSQGIEIDWLALFLLGINDLLEFGLERIHSQYLWFLIPYNFQCEVKIFDSLKVPYRKAPSFTLNELKAEIDKGKTLCIYFDNTMRNTKKKVFNQVASPVNAKGRMRYSSMGILTGYTEDSFVTDILDIDGKYISIPFTSYMDYAMGDEIAELGAYEEELTMEKIKSILCANLKNAAKRHISICDSYELDDDGKYGTQGVNCLSALQAEIGFAIDYIRKSGSQNHSKLLMQKINVLRVYSSKGSSSCYRQELADSIDYLKSLFDISEVDADNLRIELKAAGNKWRDLNRFLFSVNYPFFHERLEVFQEKLNERLASLYESEEKVGKLLFKVLKDLE
ncbi:hypothetical protein ACV3R5_14670 [Clostridium perfringens]|uniref:hypothetical protein n=1 Tax=Clostridium perfringens TaxID=1502 RepID=UPI0039E73A84